MQRRITSLVRSLYNETITAPQFVDSMAALISRQITLAYRAAWKDEGTGGAMPDYLATASEDAILYQFDFVDKFARDIVDARIDEKPIDGLLARVPLWANRYDESYNAAMLLISEQSGGKLVWVYGDTDHCETCMGLNGIVAYASEWSEAGVQPQNAPNDSLECGGWRCQCRLEPTTARRTPKAIDKILRIAK